MPTLFPPAMPESIRQYLTPSVRKKLARPSTPIPYYHAPSREMRSATREECLAMRRDYSIHQDAYDQVLIVTTGYEGLILHDNKIYRPDTARLAGIYICASCNRIFSLGSMRGEKCRECNGETIPWMESKATPPGGWRKLGFDPVYFGLEFEIEIPAHTPSRRDWIGSIPVSTAVPMVWTTDSSLCNGIEFNVHPMSLGYIEDNNDTIAAFVESVKAAGAKHTSRSGEETAAIHIHVSKDVFSPDIENNHALNVWMKAHEADLACIGKRSSGAMQRWCAIPEEGRSRAPRRSYLSNRTETVEARGFSSAVLLDDPRALPRLCSWLMALGKASKADPDEWMRLSPQALVRWAGYAYGGFPDISRVNIAAWNAQKSLITWKQQVKEYAAACVCEKVTIAADITTEMFREIAADVLFTNNKRLVCAGFYDRQILGSDSSGVSNMRVFVQDIDRCAIVPWYFLQHPTLVRPSRLAPCA